jgi:rod shape-determining protein MreD
LAFAWPVIRPAVLAPFVLMAYGAFTDLFWGAPTGLWGLSLLAAYGGALFLRQLMQGQSWQALWLWFAAFTALAMTSAYFLASLAALNPPGLWGVTWQYLATIALYPFAHRLIERFEDADVRFR